MPWKEYTDIFLRCSFECAKQNVSVRIPREAHANDGQRPSRGVPETQIEDGWKKVVL